MFNEYRIDKCFKGTAEKYSAVGEVVGFLVMVGLIGFYVLVAGVLAGAIQGG